MATDVEGCSGAPGKKGRRASLIIQATAAQLADLHQDANRSTALMAELEALLSASQAASGSANCGSSANFTSANFIATQPLEVSSDHDDDEDTVGTENGNEDIDAVLEDLSSRRLKAMRSVSRTATFVSMAGGGSGVRCQDGSLLITGTSASFTTRPSLNASAALLCTVGSPAGESRRSLSFCTVRQPSFTAPRSGPSQSNLVMASSGPPSAGYHSRGSTNSGDTAAAAGPEPSGPSQLAAAERRPSVVAWAASVSPNRRASRTAETPSVSATASAAAAAAAATRNSVHFSRRASPTSYGSFLPNLGRRSSDTSGVPVYGIGGGGTSITGGIGGGGTGTGSGAAVPGSASGGGGATSKWGAFIGSVRSAKKMG